MRSFGSDDLIVGNAGVAWDAGRAKPQRREVSVVLPQRPTPDRLGELRCDFPKLFRAPEPPLLAGQRVLLGTFEPGELAVLLHELTERAPELAVLIDGELPTLA